MQSWCLPTASLGGCSDHITQSLRNETWDVSNRSKFAVFFPARGINSFISSVCNTLKSQTESLTGKNEGSLGIKPGLWCWVQLCVHHPNLFHQDLRLLHESVATGAKQEKWRIKSGLNVALPHPRWEEMLRAAGFDATANPSPDRDGTARTGGATELQGSKSSCPEQLGVSKGRLEQPGVG